MLSIIDEKYRKFREKGYRGALNDMKYRELRDLGYSGSLNDMQRSRRLTTPFNPSSLLEGNMGLFADFSTGEGVGEETPTSLEVGGYIWSKRNSPQLVEQGLLFDRDNNDLLIAGQDLASVVDDYPLTMAMHVVSTDAGSIDFGIIEGVAGYYTLRASVSGSFYAVTRNDNYISSKIEGTPQDITLIGDFRADQTGLYTQDQGPVYHTSEPSLVSNATEISLGGLSDSTPDYGSGVVKSIFLVNRSLTEEERANLIDYMRT